MLTRVLFIAAACLTLASGAVFDPYSRRYGVCKNTMDTLLDTPAGSTSCTLIKGLYALSTPAALTPAQNVTFNAWIQAMETNIVKNAVFVTKKEKFTQIAASFKKFNLEQSVIYGKIQFLNISTWGPTDEIVKITTEWNFASSLELILQTSKKGNCKLFDLLLSACSGDSQKYNALSAFIESDLQIIISDKTKTQVDIIKAVYKAFQTKFFVGAQASWMTYFYSLKLEGFGFAFSQWSDCAISYERQTSVEVLLTGQGMSCPFILSLNATLSSASYTPTQKAFIKQLINYFTQQWSTTITIEARLTMISMKFSESIDLSYSYFACLNSIQCPGFGSFWDLIIFGCQKPNIPPTCGCGIPTYSDELTTTTEALTTTESTTTTEAATTSEATTEATTEMSTSEGTTAGTTEFSTEGTTEGSTWDSTFSSITFPSTTDGCSCSCEM